MVKLDFHGRANMQPRQLSRRRKDLCIRDKRRVGAAVAVLLNSLKILKFHRRNQLKRVFGYCKKFPFEC